MHKELIQLGETLKRRRQEKNLSLKEVENATSIRANYLEAIEQGNFGKLISPIYAQGFIKKYAFFLEMDGEQFIQQYPYVMRILNESQNDRREFSLGLGSIEVRGTPGSEVKWLPNFLWVALSVVVILVGWFVARAFGLF